jgi:alginate O-acetyltransferase complex protein AlgI
LLKKTALADPLAAVVARGFADPSSLTLLPAWQAACSYSLQLYFDFSGYTDMAIGLAWMFGLRFPDNFNQPYRATSVIDYWQRWHMSLTRFLMTNVHAPVTMPCCAGAATTACPSATRPRRRLRALSA